MHLESHGWILHRSVGRKLHLTGAGQLRPLHCKIPVRIAQPVIRNSPVQNNCACRHFDLCVISGIHGRRLVARRRTDADRVIVVAVGGVPKVVGPRRTRLRGLENTHSPVIITPNKQVITGVRKCPGRGKVRHRLIHHRLLITETVVHRDPERPRGGNCHSIRNVPVVSLVGVERANVLLPRHLRHHVRPGVRSVGKTVQTIRQAALRR